MITENASINTVKIPHQLFVSLLAFISANIFIIILNIDMLLYAGLYAVLSTALFCIVFSRYGMTRIILAILLLITLSWNLVDLPNFSIPIYQIIIAGLGAIFTCVSCFYLFFGKTRRWFKTLKEAQKKAWQEKRVLKGQQKFTTEDYECFLEIEKNIPRSYQWRKWVALLVTILSICGTVFPPANTTQHTGLFGLLFIGCMIVGTIGLFKKSHLLVEIQVTALIIALIGFCFFSLTLFLIALAHHQFTLLSIDHFFTTSSQTKINFLGGAVMFLVFYYIFLNKQSRQWLRAKRTLRNIKKAI